MPSKTTINCLFDETWCYLFIACFGWKFGIFKQTIARVYYILNSLGHYRHATLMNMTINILIRSWRFLKIYRQYNKIQNAS